MKHIVTLFTLLLLAFNVSAAHLYYGNSTYSSDIMYTYENGHVYRGNSTYSSDILYTFANTGKIYLGNSTY